MVDRITRVRDLNDVFRKRLAIGIGRLLVTNCVNDEGTIFVAKAIAKVVSFDFSTRGNDPDGEHDYGIFQLGEQNLIWNIDCYTIAGDLPTSPATKKTDEPETTMRVLTIMMDYEA